MIIQTWLLPVALMAAATIIAFPLSKYLAWIMDGKYRPLPVLGWCEKRLDSGPQDWKQYAGSLLIFNIVMFIFGYLVLALQPWMPLNPDGKGMLAPTTIFQQRDLLHDEHESAALFRGSAFVELQPDFLLHLRICSYRPPLGFCALDGHDPGFSRRSQTRQLFCGHVARDGLYVPADRL